MAKFHVNPATGEPGRCSAENGNCPFGEVSDHFDSAADAREGYEKEMTSLERREDLVKTAKKLVKTTLDLRAALDERKDSHAGASDWDAIRGRVESAKAAQQRVLEKAAVQGVSPMKLIYGVDDDGKVFNAKQAHRVRLRPDETYSKLAGVPLRAGSEVAMPGDSDVAKKLEGWKEAKVKLEQLPAGSKERAAAVKSLSKRARREAPDFKVQEQMARNVIRKEVVDRYNGNPPIGVLQRSGLSTVDGEPVGLVSQEEYDIYAVRSAKAAEEFIAGLK